MTKEATYDTGVHFLKGRGFSVGNCLNELFVKGTPNY